MKELIGKKIKVLVRFSLGDNDFIEWPTTVVDAYEYEHAPGWLEVQGNTPLPGHQGCSWTIHPKDIIIEGDSDEAD